MCVTLNYLRAANRGSKKFILIFNQNITSAFNEKSNFFGLSVLLFFLGLQIYEAIAAIFWQSASYVGDIKASRGIS